MSQDVIKKVLRHYLQLSFNYKFLKVYLYCVYLVSSNSTNFWRWTAGFVCNTALTWSCIMSSNDLEGQENIMGLRQRQRASVILMESLGEITVTLILDAYQWMDISVNTRLKEPLFDPSVRTELKKTKNKPKKEKKNQAVHAIHADEEVVVVVVGWRGVTQKWMSREKEREVK